MTITALGDTVSYDGGLAGSIKLSADLVTMIPAAGSVPGYPTGAVALSAGSANVANASGVATLTGTATTTVYISGFQVTGTGATAGSAATVTVAGLRGGTRSFTYAFATGAVIANTPLNVRFSPPIPASAVNTPIVVTCPASGTGGTNNTVNAQGFYV